MLDEATFAGFYRETAAALHHYAARTLGSSAHADDIVQEAFLRLLKHPPKSSANADLRAYVFRIAGNLIKDGWRRGRHELGSRMPNEASVNSDAALPLDMQRTFLKLRLLDRQLLWLAHVEGEPHRDIAASLGLREGSVRVLLSRARKRLSELLNTDSAIADSDKDSRASGPRFQSPSRSAGLVSSIAEKSSLRDLT